MPSPRRLLSFEFSSLCLIAFLAIANGTAYYNLFGHLAALGIPAELRGLVVGAYSLVAMALYLVASPFLTARNAPRAMQVGIAVLVVGGLSFLVVGSFWGLLLLRSFCGAGGFLLGAGATSLLVGVIPPDRSGEAFGIYSIAILAAYGIVPAGMDLLGPHLPSVTTGYALAGLVLLPASGLVVGLRRRIQSGEPPAGEAHHPPSRSEPSAGPRDPRLLLVLVIGVTYFTNWSSLYYLFKGFATERGLGNVGVFFSVLTAVMIGIRLLAGRLFDRFDKARLAALSFGMIALGHLALATLPIGMAPVIGAFFGLGLGAGYPALNGLVFEISEPRLRPQNANRMMFGVQLGSFLGPALGGALVASFGYGGYFRGSILLALASAGLSLLLVSASSPRGRGIPQAVTGLPEDDHLGGNSQDDLHRDGHGQRHAQCPLDRRRHSRPPLPRKRAEDCPACRHRHVEQSPDRPFPGTPALQCTGRAIAAISVISRSLRGSRTDR